MEGKLRELGVDPHSDPDGEWRGGLKPAFLNKSAEHRDSVLSDSFLDFGRNYVFETIGVDLSRARFSDAVSNSIVNKLFVLEELIETYFHSGNTPESIIDQNSLQEFNDYLTLDHRAKSVFYPFHYEEKEHEKSLNDFVIHDPHGFIFSTETFAELLGRPNIIWYALRELRDFRKILDRERLETASELSRSREAAQVSRVLKTLAKYKGVAFERLALIAEPTWDPEFVIVELLEN